MSNRKTTIFLFLVLITLFNIVFIGSKIGIILALIQYTVVISLFLKKKYIPAILLHFAFIITSLSVTGTSGLTEDTGLSVYNYHTLKLIGPVGFSYLISLLLFFSSFKNTRKLKHLLFTKMLRTLIALAIMGVIIGVVGLLVDNKYSFREFVNGSVFIFITIINGYILLNNHSDELLKKAYDLAPLLLMALVFATFLGYFVFHVSTFYGGLDKIIQTADAVYFASILIVGFYQIKYKTLNIISIVLLLAIYSISISGKGIFALLGSLIFLCYFSFLHKPTKKSNRSLSHIMMIVIIIGLLALGSYQLSESSLTLRKVGAFTSMFNGPLDQMDPSPYIRVASLLNILNNGLSNPFFFIFGHGFGGYFTDDLHLFDIVDLTLGGYGQEIVDTGCFPYAHDTYADVPLKNGLLGLIILMSIVVKYLKRVDKNYLSYTAFVWLGLVFYFNTLLATAGVFMLYASEYRPGLDDSRDITIDR